MAYVTETAVDTELSNMGYADWDAAPATLRARAHTLATMRLETLPFTMDQKWPARNWERFVDDFTPARGVSAGHPKDQIPWPLRAVYIHLVYWYFLNNDIDVAPVAAGRSKPVEDILQDFPVTIQTGLRQYIDQNYMTQSTGGYFAQREWRTRERIATSGGGTGAGKVSTAIPL